jgi:ATP phosphoribosyltransferase regulatory subunit
MTKPLLPAGCYDLLPPYARQQSEIAGSLLRTFESFGYEQVAPPLLEYSENLLAGRGTALSSQIFRVMDPGAHKVMGLRADITLQIARIASTRMATAPRPLRVCYNGLILRMQGEQLRGDRQLRQAGIELIGVSSAEADAEVIRVAAEALHSVGVKDLSIDLNLPGIVSALLASDKLDNEQLTSLMAAIAHKDIPTIRTFHFIYRDSLIELLQCAGPAAKALDIINRLDLPEKARKQCADLAQVVHILQSIGHKEWAITIDATEMRGLNYHSGISFSLFVPGSSCEVGRGGRYLIEAKSQEHDIEATGFTLYVETLAGMLPQSAAQKRVLVVSQTDEPIAIDLRAKGYATVYALAEYGNDEMEAKRLGCNYILKDGQMKELQAA